MFITIQVKIETEEEESQGTLQDEPSEPGDPGDEG